MNGTRIVKVSEFTAVLDAATAEIKNLRTINAELLAACKALLEIIENPAKVTGDVDHFTATQKAVEQAETAIAKATPPQPSRSEASQ